MEFEKGKDAGMITFPHDFVPENKKRTGKLCPDCKSELVVRLNSENGSFFLGCTGYPDCRHAERFEVESQDQMKFKFI